MRRLDQLLSDAADRGERMGSDWVIERLEHRLAGKPQVVIAPDRDVSQRTSDSSRRRTGWGRRSIAAVATFALVALVTSATAFLVGRMSDRDVSRTEAMELVESFFADFRNGDTESMAAAALRESFDRPLTEWLVALGAEPTPSQCGVTADSPNGIDITCRTSFGDRYFYSQVTNEAIATDITIQVTPDGFIAVRSWKPHLLAVVEPAGDFRNWIEIQHPELGERLLGSDWSGLQINRQAGELTMAQLSHYLVYLNE